MSSRVPLECLHDGISWMGFLLPQHGEGAADDAEQVVAGHPDKHRLEPADVVRIEELNPA